jgi:dimeric dUTPase (all-alpha-NTP-PPase superfamily)
METEKMNEVIQKNSSMINEMVGYQKSLNMISIPNGKTADWRLAIIIETAELLDSTSWKWWKTTENDPDNFCIELVDIWHFLLSISIEAGIDNAIVALWIGEEDFTPDDVVQINDKDLTEFIVEKFISSVVSKQHIMSIMSFINIWRRIGYDLEYLFKVYIGKNTLNKFRQVNGYTDGTYVKMWKVPGSYKTIEDNKVMLSIINDMKIVGSSDLEKISNDIFKLLEKEYRHAK